MKNDVRAFYALLRNRPFSLYVFSFYLAGFGSTMTMFAIWSQVATLTQNNPMAFGLSTILEVLPGILVAPWAGLMADRMSKRLILIATNVLSAMTVALMFLSAELWQLYALAALHSTFTAFSQPPHRALLPLLVQKEQYVTMNAFLATLNNFLQLFRPAIGGAVVGAFGYKTGFAIDFFTYFIPAVALFFLPVKDQAAQPRPAERVKRSAWRDVRDGVAYIRTEPILIYLFAFMMLLTLAMGMQGPLTFVFVGQYLATPETSSQIVGLLFSILGIGGTLGALVTPRLVNKVSMIHLMLGALLFDGLVVIVFSTCSSIPVAFTCFALFGIIMSVNQIVQDTIVQTVVPENMRGRVYGAFSPITGPMSILSMGFGTSLAAAIGTRAVFLIAGLMEVGAVGICRVLPSYSQVRRSLSEKMGIS